MDRFTSMNIFVRIIQLGSFTAVATEMGMTQSAVSKKMAALETSLGATLLTRSSRQILLTEVGTNYYEHCLSILAEMEEAETQAKEYTQYPKGNLRINIPVTFGQVHVIPYLPEFSKRYPDISIHLDLLDRRIDIIAEGFDLVFRIGHLADSSLVARTLGASPRTIVASPEYLKVHKQPHKLSDLKQLNCIVYTSLSTVNIWHFRHKGKEVTLQVGGTIQSNSSAVIRQYVLSGLGVAVLPRWLIQPDLDKGSLVTILSDYIPTEFPINAVYPKSSYTPLKIRSFVDYFREIYSQKRIFDSA